MVAKELNVDELERLFFIDCETGGFKPEENPLLEVGIRCEWGETDESPLMFSVVVKPTEEEWAACAPGALAVNQFTWKEVQKVGVPLARAGQMLASWLMQHNINSETVTWVGQNPDFDLRFMEYYLGTYLEFVGLLPIRKVTNTMDLARQLKRLDRAFLPTSLSGSSISTALGLQPEDNVHRAMGGVGIARQNYFALKKRLAQVENQQPELFRKKV